MSDCKHNFVHKVTKYLSDNHFDDRWACNVCKEPFILQDRISALEEELDLQKEVTLQQDNTIKSCNETINLLVDLGKFNNERIAALDEELELAKDTRATVDKALHERRVQVESQQERIAALEALLKDRDQGVHDKVCNFLVYDGERLCDCGHDEVTKYFKEQGK